MKLNKPNNYEDVQVNEDFEKMELGGHKGVIKSVEEYTSQISENTSLKVEVDTDKDDKQPGYYQKQYDENTNDNKRWSSAATKYVSLKEDENCVKMLKGFITAVENSNKGFIYDWNKEIDQLKGKKVGLIFGLEEYKDKDGNVKTATKLTQFRSIDKVDNASIPKVKLLDGSFISYDEYKPSKQQNASTTNPYLQYDEVVEIGDDFLD